MKKILIYDDEGQSATRLKEDLEKLPIVTKDFNIETLGNTDFEESMNGLQERQKVLRKPGKWKSRQIVLDDADIFIVDYDLVESDAARSLTGERVAYLARCFSKCKLIVGVNQYGENPFDLTLKGTSETFTELASFADLNVGRRQLDNPNLWGGTGEEFRAWYWPNLPNYLLHFEKKVEEVGENLDFPICDVLEFDSELFNLLPRSISQFIGKFERRELAETTFRQFAMKSGNGLDAKDAVHANDEILARVGSARISKWLEWLVLPEQDILVDAPHLISRYPSLMTGDNTEIETWNRTAHLTSYKKLGLQTDSIAKFRFKKDYWLSRSVWFWDELRECEEILEVNEPWKTTRENFVFCEDASRFYEEEVCREFVADTESPFARRFVKEFENVDYKPRVRFSL